jgi:hypothetical protein
MTRNLKILGAAIVAALAFGAVSCSAALAAKFTAGSYPASVSTQQGGTPLALTFAGGRAFECAKVTSSTTLSEASESIETKPESSECTTVILGEKKPSRTTVSCAGTYKHVTKADGTTEESCSAGYTHHVAVFKNAEFKEELCVYKIGELGSVKGVSFANLEGTNGIEATYNISGISYERIIGTATLCGVATSTATYTGTSILTAKNGEGTAIGFDVN